MLTIDRSTRGHILLIECGGELDVSSAAQLGAAIRDEIAEGARFIVLDLQSIEKIGAEGAWQLMTALKRVRRLSGDLCFACPSDGVREGMAASGLDQIMRMYETQADAIRSF